MPAAIHVSGLTKSYRRAPIPALLDVSLEINAGEIFGLIGPNGAGKRRTIAFLKRAAEPRQPVMPGLDPFR
jgi:ABC-type multidrug transport system ATPase subunit